MNYKKAEEYLLKSLPMYQRIGSQAYKGDLSNALILDKYFGYPHQRFKTIHIAGTNGKGSVSHMLASVLQQSGYRTGLFTSPHLLDYRERTKVDGVMIPRDFVAEFVEKHMGIFTDIKPSFFEISVFLAFDYFVHEKVDIAVIEVGLGGRLDTTNIITPEISVITNIGLDHTQILGNTLQSIAAEKAGIIKQGVPVIIGETQSEIRSIFQHIAADKNSSVRYADEYISIDYQMENFDGTISSHFEKCYHWKFQSLQHDLKGVYQRKNIPVVLMTLAVLAEKNHIRIDERKLQEGFRNVVSSTGLMGRWQEISYDPLIICDTAHNAEGFAEIVKQIKNTPWNSLYMILGFVQDKDISPIVKMLPKNASYFLCEANIPRAMEAEVLAEYFQHSGLHFQVHRKVSDAFQSAVQQATVQDMIYIGGSTFVVADFLAMKKAENSF